MQDRRLARLRMGTDPLGCCPSNQRPTGLWWLISFLIPPKAARNLVA